MRNEILNLTYRNYALELNVGNCVFIVVAGVKLPKNAGEKFPLLGI